MGLLLALLLAQVAGAITVSREYNLINEQKNWTDAQRYCRERHGDLATIGSPEEQARVDQLAGGTAAWIGLYDDVNSWKWSLDNSSVNDQGDWFVFQTDNLNSDEHCGYMNDNHLADDSCQNTLPSVCYHEPMDNYIPVLEALTWRSAQSHCRSMYTDLASVRNLQEMERVKSIMAGTNWWVGLSRETWKWSDQSISSFMEWRSSEPNGGHENCVILGMGGWNDAPCDWAQPFICSTPIQWKKVVKTVLTSGGAVDPNEPQVQEAVLKHVGVMKLETQMRGQAIPEEVGLTWRKQPHGKVFNATSTQP